jgi:hypothetical protein
MRAKVWGIDLDFTNGIKCAMKVERTFDFSRKENMCVSSNLANFSNTMVYVGKHLTKDGEIHVLGYQNNPQNLSSGPNAMILHFPASEAMTEKNVLDTSKCPSIFRDMVTAVATRGMGMSRSMTTFGVQSKAIVFDHGIYTIILAKSPDEVSEALSRVPLNKRPPVSPELLEFYKLKYPGWPLAVCCFNNADVESAEPLMWWYKPLEVYDDQGQPSFILPGVDSHDGSPPNMNALVERDHWLILSTPELNSVNGGYMVNYSEPIPQSLMSYLPKYVVGFNLAGKGKNGDFYFPKALSGRAVESQIQLF